MPTIDENIAELQQKTTDLITAHTNIKNAIIAKGGTVNDGDKFSDYPEDIETIKNDLTSISINENGTYKNGTLDTVTGTEYPIEIDANGEPIVSMTVNGNTVQDGTPTPTAPVNVVGVGIKSNNLIRCVNTTSTTGGGAVINQTAGKSEIIIVSRTATESDSSVPIDVLAELSAGTYTLSVDGIIDRETRNVDRIFIRDEYNNVIVNNVQTGKPQQFTISEDVKITKLSIVFAATAEYSNQVVRVILNEGESPLPYEPYGYYLPTSINGGNNIDAYFGNYQTTRKIKKFVLTGTESGTWFINTTILSGVGFYNTAIFSGYKPRVMNGYCTHYPLATTINVSGVYFGDNINFITAYTEGLDTVDKWKEYLQQQYAAGTPVTVWYVLDTPQTTTSSEPLMKLGDYADQLTLTDSDITLPTVTGNNLIDYDLTVKPSSAAISYYKLGVSKTITSDTLPIEFESTGDPLTSYSITGQTVQNGTPAPSQPVDVNGTGDNTGNLFDKDRTQGIIADVYINQSGEQISSQNYYLSYPIEVLENSVYTWSFVTLTSAVHSAPTVAFYDINDELLSVATHNSNIKHFTFTTPPNAKYIRGSVYKGYSQNTTMFLEGGTQIADTMSMNYIPYGYKIPISSNDTTTPVYLGEVQTTRRIKKLVLSSSQNWQLQSINSHGIANFYIIITNDFLDRSLVISNYFTPQTTPIADTTTEGILIAVSTTTTSIYIRINSQTASTAQEFKNWLDGLSEEAVFWYVLAEPTTGVVNEPLMRIGDYADTLSSVQAQVQIPTTVGHNTFNVNTTVKPSSTSITYNDLNTIGYNEINVDVPNTYTVEDEGKVVNSGTLVAQTAMPTEITTNDTYDTTFYNSIVVNVPTGGSTGTKNDVTFYDYDGTIVTSYSKDEFANLTALPDNPSHEGLTAQGWNWSLVDAKAYVADYGSLNIGQMYVTDDGKTRLHIRLGDGRLKPYLGLTGNSSGTVVSIDWGDGSVADSVTLNTSTIYTPHEYSTSGDYTISVTVTSGSIILNGSSSHNSNILRKSSSPNGDNDAVYQNSLISIEIGTNVSIGNYALYNCYSLQSIIVPSTVTSISSNAFQQCYSLSSITIPNSVTSIGQYAFQSCASLTSIIIPNSVTSISSQTFVSCYSLHSITIPNSVTSIGNAIFYSNASLTSIIIPNSVTSISSQIFQYCRSLTSITIPNRVTSIGDSAFQSCNGLGSIKFTSTTPPTVSNSNTWSNIQSDCTMLVPINTYSAYTTATNYPSSSTYTYLVFGTYESGELLPSTSTDNYTLTWYASIADAIAQTNPITTGNGNEIYARCVAI